MYNSPDLKRDIPKAAILNTSIGTVVFAAIFGLFTINGWVKPKSDQNKCTLEKIQQALSESSRLDLIEEFHKKGCKRLEVRALSGNQLALTNTKVENILNNMADPDLNVTVVVSDGFLYTGSMNQQNNRLVIIDYLNNAASRNDILESER